MKYKGVSTTYQNNGRFHCSYIIADSMEEAEQLRRERNIGERITSGIIKVDVLPDYRALNDDDFIRRIDEIMEQVAFLGYVSFAAGRSKLEQVLGDESLLKRMIALKSVGIPTEIILPLRAELNNLQLLAPGVFPFGRPRQERLITVNVKPGTSRAIQRIVDGSTVTNLGPASVTICDCAEPDCGITDDDQPCGYEQTIDERHMATLNTVTDLIYIHNRDTVKMATVQVRVREWRGSEK